MIRSGVFGIVKTTLSNTLALREDISWGLYPIYGWACSEAFINIVCGSLPTLKPLYEKVVNKKPLGISRQSSSFPASSGLTADSKGKSSRMRRLLFRDTKKHQRYPIGESNAPRDSLDMGQFADEGNQIWTQQSFWYSYSQHRDDAV